MNNNVLEFEEGIIFALRALFTRYGYRRYAMSKFEEYELYARNKEFLVSDRVITFNDTNGKLMALKPDVTLSIINNVDNVDGTKQKFFYDENVYRVSESTNRFKEIQQTGLECIGDIDIYDIYEVITLAAESIASISDDFYIEIGNLDIVSEVVSSVCENMEFISRVNHCIAQKNTHDLRNICNTFSVDEKGYEKIAKIASLYGDRNKVISELRGLCDNRHTESLNELSALLDNSRYSDRIKFDFSLINDMNYYNGFVFSGYIDGMYCSVLAGGQYGKMMKKMKRNSEAVGFALYLDKIGELYDEHRQYDADILLLYNDTDASKVVENVAKLIDEGYTVDAQKTVPSKLRYREIIDLR